MKSRVLRLIPPVTILQTFFWGGSVVSLNDGNQTLRNTIRINGTRASGQNLSCGQ